MKVTEKLSKNKDQGIKIERMWGMKTTIPVVIKALGLIKKGMDKCIQKIPGNIKIHEQPRSQGTLSNSRKYPGYGWSRVC